MDNQLRSMVPEKGRPVIPCTVIVAALGVVRKRRTTDCAGRLSGEECVRGDARPAGSQHTVERNESNDRVKRDDLVNIP
jgi:hypothetical protein